MSIYDQRREINPFSPGDPARPEMFIGRTEEVEAIATALHDTSVGKPSHFLVSGGAGIGKTSLLDYLGHKCKDNEDFKLIVINVSLDENTGVSGLIEKIEQKMDFELRKTKRGEAILNDLRKSAELSKFSLLGLAEFSFKGKNEGGINTLREQFVRHLKKTIKKLRQSNDYHGIVIFIDNAEQSSKLTNLFSFFKATLEELNRSEFAHLMVIIAGILPPDLVSQVRKTARVFRLIPLERLSDSEVHKLITHFLKHAKHNSGSERTISQDGLDMLINISKGHPYFVQEFGSSALQIASTSQISLYDVFFGAYRAFTQIGDCYYDVRLSSQAYKSIESAFNSVIKDILKKLIPSERYNETDFWKEFNMMSCTATPLDDLKDYIINYWQDHISRVNYSLQGPSKLRLYGTVFEWYREDFKFYRQHIVEHLVNELQGEWKTVFNMRLVGDLSFNDIADIIEIDTSSGVMNDIENKVHLFYYKACEMLAPAGFFFKDISVADAANPKWSEDNIGELFGDDAVLSEFETPAHVLYSNNRDLFPFSLGGG